jgi:hypothetical protein
MSIGPIRFWSPQPPRRTDQRPAGSGAVADRGKPATNLYAAIIEPAAISAKVHPDMLGKI